MSWALVPVFSVRNALAARLGRRRAGGFALPSAIFLLVILASLAAFLVHLSTVQSATSAQDVQGSRAFHAARAGLEWGLYRVMMPATPSCAASTVLSATIDGFTVTVACNADGPYSEGGQSFSQYRLVSTARTSGAPGTLGYVERQVSATISR